MLTNTYKLCYIAVVYMFTRKYEVVTMISSQTYFHNGKSLTLTEWSAETGVSRRNLDNRLRIGRSLAEAIAMGDSRPRATGQEKFAAFGEERTLVQWAARYNITLNTLTSRLMRNSLEDSLDFTDKRGQRTRTVDAQIARIQQKAAEDLQRRREMVALRIVEALADRGEPVCVGILGKIDNHPRVVALREVSP